MIDFRRPLGADLRSLAVFRIALSCLVGADLIGRAQALRAHYTDAGVLPRAVLTESFSRTAQACLHLATGSVSGEAVLFAAGVFAALALMIGWRTRAACAATWALTVSLQCRNPAVLYGMDNLLRLLLFWGMFVPLGARFSIDSAGQHLPDGSKENHFSMGTAALLLQVTTMYWFAAAAKSGEEWLKEGSALYYAFHIEHMKTPLAVWLLQFPGALKLLTFAAVHWEWAGALLLLSPIAFVRARLIALGGFLALQVGIFLTLRVGLFPWANLVALIPFIPSEGWRFFGKLSLRGPTVSSRFRDISRRLPPGGPPMFRLSRAGQAAVLVCGLYAFAWNLASFPPAEPALPGWFWTPGFLLRLDQDWSMFAPFPMKDTGWYVVRGVLSGGRPVDLLRWTIGEPPAGRQEPPMSNYRWRKYLFNLREDYWSDQRIHYAKYLCREWGRTRPEEEALKQVEIIYMLEEIGPDSVAEPRREKIISSPCF